jgi:hypothetical protein
MRARWLALGLLLGLASIATAQGGAGFFMSPSCATLANPVSGSTVCWQTTEPLGWQFWNGVAFSAAPLGDPYSPSVYSSGALLVGNGTGALQATLTPSISGITTSGQAALTVNPYGASGGNTGEVRLMELTANGSNYVALSAGDNIATSIKFVWPSVPGSNGQCFVTDGGSPTATLSYGACSGGGSGITSLNALVTTTQTFTNDTNVTIVSGGSAHVITWAGSLAVARGGTGVGTFTLNGVLYGNGTSPVQATAAGAADTVLRIPGGGGAPGFGAIDVSKAAAVTGLVRPANLGGGSPSSTTFLRGDQVYASSTGVPVYNYVWNSDLEVWGAGPTASPTGWTSLGGTFAKNTTANQFRTGAAAVSVTRTAGTAGLTQDLVVANPTAAYWQGQVVACGAWVRATVASTTRIRLDDGSTVTSSANHTGGSTLEFLTVSASVGGGAAVLKVGLVVDTTNTTSQFDSIICVLGASIPNWQPSGWVGRKTLLAVSTTTGTVNPGTSTFFGNGYISNTERDVAHLMPYRCVCRKLYGRVTNAPFGTDTVTMTVRKSEADTSIVVVFTNQAKDGSDLTHEAVWARGDRLAIRMVLSSDALVTAGLGNIECEEVPEGV